MKASILSSTILVLVLVLTSCVGQSPATPASQPPNPAAGATKPEAEAPKAAAPAKAPTLDKIKYVDSGRVATYSVLWVGVDAGIFKENGLDVDVITAQSTAPAIQSILSGEAQMGNADTVGALTANQKGADLVTVMSYQKTVLYDLFVRKEIQTAQDLKGKKIAISRFGGTAENMSRVMMSKLGLDPDKDITFIQVGGGPERAAALLNNSVQADIASPPEPVVLAKEPSLRRLTGLADLGVVYPYFSFITTRKYLNEHRDVFKRFVKAYLESLKYYATHKKESIDIMSKWLNNNNQEELNYVYQSNTDESYIKPYITSDPAMFYEFAQRDIKAPITVKWDETYDNSFVKELDESGFIDKLFDGVNNVLREVPTHK